MSKELLNELSASARQALAAAPAEQVVSDGVEDILSQLAEAKAKLARASGTAETGPSKLWKREVNSAAWDIKRVIDALSTTRPAVAPPDVSDRYRAVMEAHGAPEVVGAIVADLCDMEPFDTEQETAVCVDVNDLILVLKRHLAAHPNTGYSDDMSKFNDDDVRGWIDRHDLGGSLGLTDAWSAISDARSLEAAPAQGNGKS